MNPRKSSLNVLNTLDQGHRTLDSILQDDYGSEIFTSRQDRALFQALVFGVLRWRGRLDFIISHFSSTRFDKINPIVLNILRLALFQIIYLDRIPVSAAVNTAVDLAKTIGAPWVVGYVNAMLRKAAREHQKVPWPDSKHNAAAAMAVNKSFPEWIIRKWLSRYGLDNTTSLCDSLNSIPPLAIRTNTLKTSRSQLMEALRSAAAQIKPTDYSPVGITFNSPTTAIPDLPAFKAGWFQVQDEAAQLVSLLLDPQPGETVLDACAGLGGKTGHIAQMMENQGILAAWDVNAGKLLRLDTEMRRLGVSIQSTRIHNLEQQLPRDRRSGFDRVLLDAPCSGLGVMRRNPDAKWRISAKDLNRKYKIRQLRMLDSIAHLVKPGGVLVYAVCSPEPEETEIVAKEFLKNHAEFAISNDSGRLPNQLRAMSDTPGVLQTYPLYKQMDGFYAVRLQRQR